jgi:hypothetical protein
VVRASRPDKEYESVTIKYTNRKGKTYYLHQGTTKNNKVRFYFSQNTEGDLADAMPDGYEIYENPNGGVYIRKARPQVISDDELAAVENELRQFSHLRYCQVDVKKGIISIHTPDQDVDGLLEIARSFSMVDDLEVQRTIEQLVTYSPELRFVLVDREARLFQAQRYCYRGSIDDWIDIGEPGKMEELVDRYVKRLETEAFFDLF